MTQTIQTDRKETISVSKNRKIRFDVSTDQGSYTPNHWHEALEIIYILEGSAEVTSFGQTTILNTGDFMLLNSHQIHASRCPSYNRTILMQVPDEFLEPYLPGLKHLWFFIPVHEPNTAQKEKKCLLKELLLKMMDLQEAERPGYLLEFTSTLFSFLNVLYQNFQEHMPSECHIKDNRVLSRLDSVIAYTQDHYSSAVTLKEAARAAALQPEYFCRFFRQNMGMTYFQYLNDYRLSRIYRDLIATDLSVHTLEEIHGFTNDKLFHKLFKERFRTTPLQVRKKQAR